MTERSYFWDTTGGGDGQVYTQVELMDRFFRAVLNGAGNQGVLKGWEDELEVTGVSSPLSVGAGGATLYGMFYETTTAVNVNISLPASDSRTDLIVVRRSWAAQTCRIARIQGPGAALVQTYGTTWDVPLASVEVTSGGVFTITDTRDYATFSTTWPSNSVDSEQYAAQAVTPAKIPDRTRYQFRGAGRLETQVSLYGCEWVGEGGLYATPYDRWQMNDGVTDGLWAYFFPPVSIVGNVADFYVWSVPERNGLGVGAENVHWDLYVYQGSTDTPFSLIGSSATLVDQQARLEDNIYADQLIASQATTAQLPILVLCQRAGAQADDTYIAPIRYMGVEMRFTADC